jgi:hypothetical protein
MKHSHKTENTAYNSTFAIVGVQCSAESFVAIESLVFRINICGENRQLLVAAKRYALEETYT